MTQISKGIMLSREKLKAITVPTEALQQFPADATNFLVIFNPP
jgi:hypothetical protein